MVQVFGPPSTLTCYLPINTSKQQLCAKFKMLHLRIFCTSAMKRYHVKGARPTAKKR